MIYVCINTSVVILNTQFMPAFPLGHTQRYSLMTSVTRGWSKPYRAGDESPPCIQPCWKQQAHSGEPSLSLHVPHHFWFNVHTQDWLRTAARLHIKVTRPALGFQAGTGVKAGSYEHALVSCCFFHWCPVKFIWCFKQIKLHLNNCCVRVISFSPSLASMHLWHQSIDHSSEIKQ